MGKISRCVTLLGILTTCGLGFAQDHFPSRPIQVVVTATAGSQADLLARFLGNEAAKSLGQQVVVVNQANSTGTIGANAVKRSAADGYTILLGGNTTMAANVHLVKNLGYDPLTNFDPVALITANPLVLVVRADLPLKSVAELIAYAKSHPGKLNYGMGNSGSKVAASLLQTLTGVNAVEIPFRGASQAMQELVAGRLDFMFSDPLIAEPFIQQGILRALALTSSAKPPSMRSLPTMVEAGVPDYQEIMSFLGYYVPKGTPDANIQTLNQAFVTAINSPEGQAQYRNMGLVPKPSSPAQLAEFTRTQVKIWEHLVKVSGMEPQ